jgi:ferredoxin
MKKYLGILFALSLFIAVSCNDKDNAGFENADSAEVQEVSNDSGACGGCSGCGSVSDCPSSKPESEEVKNLEDDEFADPEIFEDDFQAAGDEFESTDESGEFDNVGDEFESTDETGEFQEAGDEFSENLEDDEFGEFEETEDGLNTAGFEEESASSSGHNGIPKLDPGLELVLWIFALTILAGFLQLFKAGRKLRIVVMVFAVLWLGFYRGACPCMLSSLQNFIFWLKGNDISWTAYLWFLGLIPITYFFGRVWCGWVCHLGGIQELLYRPGKFKLLQSQKAQKILKYSRIFFSLALIAQILITNTNEFVHIDPFKGMFNIYVSNLTMGVLMGLLIVSSIFIQRPFCRAACPVGLILGLVSRLPGASVLRTGGECTACNRCEKACDNGAIYRIEKISELNNEDCIRCGECIDDCKKHGLRSRISKRFSDFKQKLCGHA